jgi:hypothetical protein
MESLSDLLLFTRSDSVGSIVIRGLIWLVVVLLFAAGLDSGRSYTKLKTDAGWFFLFLLSIGIASYYIFGFSPTF